MKKSQQKRKVIEENEGEGSAVNLTARSNKRHQLPTSKPQPLQEPPPSNHQFHENNTESLLNYQQMINHHRPQAAAAAFHLPTFLQQNKNPAEKLTNDQQEANKMVPPLQTDPILFPIDSRMNFGIQNPLQQQQPPQLRPIPSSTHSYPQSLNYGLVGPSVSSHLQQPVFMYHKEMEKMQYELQERLKKMQRQQELQRLQQEVQRVQQQQQQQRERERQLKEMINQQTQCSRPKQLKMQTIATQTDEIEKEIQQEQPQREEQKQKNNDKQLIPCEPKNETLNKERVINTCVSIISSGNFTNNSAIVCFDSTKCYPFAVAGAALSNHPESSVKIEPLKTKDYLTATEYVDEMEMLSRFEKQQTTASDGGDDGKYIFEFYRFLTKLQIVNNGRPISFHLFKKLYQSHQLDDVEKVFVKYLNNKQGQQEEQTTQEEVIN